ncbi:IclR family transcriptional regulator [Janthinobacterium sp. HLX7-2]|uniref:IclR family transcriptional regulator n=1 Tax=Janthinobacterium sp. HLX7-2 TaxID=1259331 RepID=UPI003F26B853
MTESNSSLIRMLAVLDAFTAKKYAWTVDELAGHFGYTVASTYRYVKALGNAGLLIRLPRGVYVVGGRVIELEALIRDTDPLTQVGGAILQELVNETGCDVLLSNVYGDHLMNVFHQPGVEALGLSYFRGRNLPWFKGSPSKAVLAFLPRARVRHLFDATFGAQADEAQWTAAVKELRAIRKAGYCVSLGELDPDVVGFAAPVVLENDVIGSVSLTCSRKRARLLNQESIGNSLQTQCAELARRLSASDMPPADT